MIQIDNIIYAYEGEPALRGVSLNINAGEFIVVLGHNGSGKSTLAKMLNALIIPSGGKVYIDGMDSSDERNTIKIRNTVGMVFQNPDNQFVATLVEDDVAFGCENLGIESSEIRKRVDDALSAVGMSEYAGHDTHRLSGGQKQRVAIAGVLAMQPKCIILDESTAMLDPRGRDEVLEAVHKLNKELGITIILITHHMREAIGADRVVVLSDGFILADGTPSSVFANTEVLDAAGLDVPDTVKLNLDLGLPMDNLSVEDCSQAIYDAVQNKNMTIQSKFIENLIPNTTTPDVDNAILLTEQLKHIYSIDTPFETEALKGVDFKLYKGTFAGLIGHTGSGKSTFIQHLNGLLKPSSGRVLLSSEDIWASGKILPGVRGKVGLVFQYPEYQLFEETVYKDIAFGPINIHIPENELDYCVREAARFVDLNPELLEKSPFALSGGEKRRAAIAGVIAMRPDVLILDEPTAGLDPAGRDYILSNLKRYHEETGCTVLLVTHSMDDIAKYADVIYVFNKGNILMQGEPDTIFTKAKILRDIGLDVPEITQVILRLNELGLPINTSIHTVSAAIKEIQKYA